MIFQELISVLQLHVLPLAMHIVVTGICVVQ